VKALGKGKSKGSTMCQNPSIFLGSPGNRVQEEEPIQVKCALLARAFVDRSSNPHACQPPRTALGRSWSLSSRLGPLRPAQIHSQTPMDGLCARWPAGVDCTESEPEWQVRVTLAVRACVEIGAGNPATQAPTPAPIPTRAQTAGIGA
jgi:hypothetical protein